MPQTPAELIAESLELIAGHMSFQEVESPDSHTVIRADGLDHADIPRALARYAVALLAGWVQRNATIGTGMGVVGIANRHEIQLLVDRVTVPPEGLIWKELENWKRTWRNAWIAEVLTHALLLIRRSHPSDWLVGDVLALLRPHPLPKRQGLDSVAIYEEEGISVVAIGETKATRDHGSEQLTEACDIYDDVDKGLYGPDLRDAIDQLANVLPDHLVPTISNDIWRDERCYAPTIVHQVPFDGATSRPRLLRLQPIKERKRVLLLAATDFDQLHDDVARAMQNAIEELVV